MQSIFTTKQSKVPVIPYQRLRSLTNRVFMFAPWRTLSVNASRCPLQPQISLKAWKREKGSFFLFHTLWCVKTLTTLKSLLMSQSSQWDQVPYKILFHTGNWPSSYWGGSSSILMSLADMNTVFLCRVAVVSFPGCCRELVHWGECAFEVLNQLLVWLGPPATNCANRLLLPEMLPVDVYCATTHSWKKSCLLAVSSGKISGPYFLIN